MEKIVPKDGDKYVDKLYKFTKPTNAANKT